MLSLKVKVPEMIMICKHVDTDMDMTPMRLPTHCDATGHPSHRETFMEGSVVWVACEHRAELDVTSDVLELTEQLRKR